MNAAPRKPEYTPVAGHRVRPKPNPYTDAARGGMMLCRAFAVRSWFEFEGYTNLRVPAEVRVRELPSSCAVCLFGWRNQSADASPLLCLATHRMMSHPSLDIHAHRAAFCPLVEDPGAWLAPGTCPALEKMKEK